MANQPTDTGTDSSLLSKQIIEKLSGHWKVEYTFTDLKNKIGPRLQRGTAEFVLSPSRDDSLAICIEKSQDGVPMPRPLTLARLSNGVWMMAERRPYSEDERERMRELLDVGRWIAELNESAEEMHLLQVFHERPRPHPIAAAWLLRQETVAGQDADVVNLRSSSVVPWFTGKMHFQVEGREGAVDWCKVSVDGSDGKVTWSDTFERAER